jgi:hypothetical protein
MRKLLLGTTILMTLMVAAKADTVVTYGGIDWTINANSSQLTLVNQAPPGNQVTNIPCVVCGTNQPQQFQNFGFNNYKQTGNQTDFTAFSDADPVHGGVQLDNNVQGSAYTASFLRAFALAQLGQNADFNIGIDVNSGNTIERLSFFGVLDVANHVVLAAYNPGGLGTSLPVNNNGTGFPDYFLTGFDINRNDILPGANFEFVAAWNNASDGAESFFLVPQAAAVPGPVVGAGIPGLITLCLTMVGLARHRRNKTS